MLPIIVRLGAVKLAQSAANDAGRALVARDLKGRFVPLAKAAVNDKHDYANKTLDRIMQRHNGHDRAIPAAANAPTPYEKTMDRIMQRHNGHDRIIPEPVNDTKHRIFHEPTGPLAQAKPKERNWESYEEKPLQLRKKFNGENENSAKLHQSNSRDNALLKKIEKNTDRSTKLLEELVNIAEDRHDGMGVDSLRAREMALEGRQGNRPWDRNTNSSMDSWGKEDIKSKWAKKLEALKGLKGNVVSAGALIALGVGAKIALSAAGGDDKKQNPVAPGGGHTGKEQAPTRKADDPRRNAASPPPKAAPQAKPLPPVVEPPKPPRAGAKPDVMGQTKADSTGEGVGYVKASQIPTKVKGDRAFQDEVTRLAKKYRVAEDDLYRVMSFETGGSFDPAQKNMAGSSGTGLIQFMAKTAKGLGTSTQELSKMSRAEQMKWVDKYFKENRLNKIKNPTIDDLYMTIFKPKMVGAGADAVHSRKGSKEYRQNSGQDINHDGIITQSEVTRKMREHEMDGIGKYKAPTGRPKPRGSYVEGSDIWMSDESRKKLRPGDAAEIKKIFAAQSKRAAGMIPLGSGQGSVTVNVNNNGGKQQAAPKAPAEKRRVPAAKPNQGWSELAKKYFGW